MQAQISLLDSFTNYLKINKGSSKNSLSAYKTDIKQYVHYLSSINHNISTHQSIANIDNTTLNNYIQLLQNNNYKTSSIVRKLASIRLLYKYFIDTNVVNHDPTDHLNSIEREITIPQYLSSDDMSILLNASYQSITPLGQRDALILSILYRTAKPVSYTHLTLPTIYSV